MRKLINLTVFTALAVTLHSANAVDTANPSGGDKFCWQDDKFEQLVFNEGQPDSLTVYYYPENLNVARQAADFALQADKELQKFFNLKRLSPFRLYIASDRPHYERLSGRNMDWVTDWWVVGTMLTANDQVIVNPEKWDPRSHTFVYLNELVKHEMGHSFAYAVRGQFDKEQCLLSTADQIAKKEKQVFKPNWIEEGIATLAAGQVKTWQDRVVDSINGSPSFLSVTDPEKLSYGRSGAVFQFLVDRFGRKSVINSLKIVTEQCKEDQEACDKKYLEQFAAPETLDSEWLEYARKHWPQAF